MSLEDATNTISIIRDVALIVILLLATTILLFLYVRLSKALNSVARTVSNLADIVDALSNKIIAPAAAGSGLAFGAGKLAAFMAGFSKKGKAKGGEKDGK